MAINLSNPGAAPGPARKGRPGVAPGPTQGPGDQGGRPVRAARPTGSARSAARRRHGSAAAAWLYLAPALLLLAVFRFWPTVWGIYLSFFDVRPYLGNQWIGLANFRQAFDDPALRVAVAHTLIDAAASVIGSAVLGFFLALLLEGPARHLRMLRTAVFLPVVVSMVAAAELWNDLLFPAGYGGANSVAGLLGLGPFPYLSSPHSALISVIGVQVWKSAPYDMMIFVAGLASIDRDLYEAAAIDGAKAWQRLKYITLPSLRPVTTIVLTLGTIRGLRVFTEIYVLTNGGPAGATQTVVPYDYLQATTNNDIGYAAAISTVLLAFTVLATVLVLRWRRRAEE